MPRLMSSDKLPTHAASSQTDWYIPQTNPTENVLDISVKEAHRRFVNSSKQYDNALFQEHNTSQDVQSVVESCMTEYQSRSPESKALKWLRKLSDIMISYEGVIDTIIQQHPESVSLIWGTMKFLFLGIINHEKTVKGLAKALTSIADELPRVGLLSEMYPTDKMKRAVAELVVGILEFLTRAQKWYTEGRMKRAFHSFTQPFDLRYGDILATISRNSTVVKELANCGFIVEFRDFKSTNLSRLDKIHDLLLEQGANNSIIMSATLDTNRRIDDFQFVKVMQNLSNKNMWTPDEIIAHLQASRRRSSQNEVRLLAKTFWEIPRIRRWTLSRESDISIVKTTFNSRQALRLFCVDVIEQLRLESIPVFLALGTPHEGAAAHTMTTTDLLKYIVCQILDLQRCKQDEKSMSVIDAAMSSNFFEKDCFSLLEHSLLQLSGDIYFVIDLELLIRDNRTQGIFNWLSNFRALFKSLAENGGPTRVVKVLLISYSNELPFKVSPSEQSDHCTTARLAGGRLNRLRGQTSVPGRMGKGTGSRFRKTNTH